MSGERTVHSSLKLDVIDYEFPIRDTTQSSAHGQILKQCKVYATTNDLDNGINNIIPGEEKIYMSIDTMTDERESISFPTEFLNSLDVPGMPLHCLKLKLRPPIILLRNLNSPKLCNGTRICFKQLQNNIIKVIIMTEKNTTQSTFWKDDIYFCAKIQKSNETLGLWSERKILRQILANKKNEAVFSDIAKRWRGNAKGPAVDRSRTDQRVRDRKPPSRDTANLRPVSGQSLIKTAPHYRPRRAHAASSSRNHEMTSREKKCSHFVWETLNIINSNPHEMRPNDCVPRSGRALQHTPFARRPTWRRPSTPGPFHARSNNGMYRRELK
ncbi:hypothetical protein EVAR_17771_1 [Eumeta japonica]|uniref:DNA helicase Pif1-like 2B domain-containing protein n=1 Tax=Eumeta variegata TaxID=151549 RepID=A0A4C1TTD7_EUMVA|nr:hypothetical protein EVAR_17771_1 [Eumeta japonica]